MLSRIRLSSTWVKNWLIVSVSLDSFVTRLPLAFRSKKDIDWLVICRNRSFRSRATIVCPVRCSRFACR
ncbi:hypothetical protein D3C87_2051540 [compost metagenome]